MSIDASRVAIRPEHIGVTRSGVDALGIVIDVMHKLGVDANSTCAVVDIRRGVCDPGGTGIGWQRWRR